MNDINWVLKNYLKGSKRSDFIDDKPTKPEVYVKCSENPDC